MQSNPLKWRFVPPKWHFGANRLGRAPGAAKFPLTMATIESLRFAPEAPSSTPLYLVPRTATWSEHETILRAQFGDPHAWEILFRRNAGWVMQACSHWPGSRSCAADLTQEVFLRAFRNLHLYRCEVAGFRPWLARLTRNLLIDSYRRMRRERPTVSYDSGDVTTQVVIRTAVSGEAPPDARIEARERAALLREGLAQLRPELRDAVILRDVHGLSYGEIGRRLRLPTGTAKSRVSRARAELTRLVRSRATA
jgi:RNA polymerase sigma-70 factor, ECF subfamily